MRYGKISEAIWTDDKFTGLSDTSKLLFVYLLSCSRCNSVGIFPMGLGAIEDEFGHERSEIKRSIGELEGCGLVRYESGWFCFSRFLKWNAPVSPNHARQIAAVLNDCVMQNAPVGAVCSFLGSVKGILTGMSYKCKDGRTVSYWDEFMNVLDKDAVTACLGGEEAFKACVRGGSCGVRGSAPKALPKHSLSTFQSGAACDPEKGSGSTSEVLAQDSGTRNRSIQETETYQTRQDKTRISLGLACKNAREEVGLFCNDGEVRNVSDEAVSRVASLHPDWDMHLLKIRLQVLTSMQEETRPSAEDLDGFFLSMSAYFDGDSLQWPQNQFSAQEGVATPPTERNASEGASGAYAER